MSHGFTDSEWRRAVTEAITILRQRAAQRDTITYGELSDELHTITIGCHEPAMGLLLAGVSMDLRGKNLRAAAGCFP
jgi:hypothetical protein